MMPRSQSGRSATWRRVWRSWLSRRRVAITGIGAVSALGPNLGSFRAGIFSGISGIRKLTRVPEGALRFTNGAEVAGFDPGQHFDPKLLALLDPFTQYAIAAAREAVRDSGVVCNGKRTAIITGTGDVDQSSAANGY